MPIVMYMEGTRPIVMNMEGTRPPTGASPTQPYKCSQYVKVKTALILALTSRRLKNEKDVANGRARGGGGRGGRWGAAGVSLRRRPLVRLPTTATGRLTK